MTAASIWFVQHAAADAVEPLMQRSRDLACAFYLWFASRHEAICEMNTLVQVKSRVNSIFMASIVDAWARLAIKSERGPVEPSVRHPSDVNEADVMLPSEANEEEFLGDKLVPRGPRVRISAQAWSSLSPSLQFDTLPGAEKHTAAILSLLQARRMLWLSSPFALSAHRMRSTSLLRKASRIPGASSDITQRCSSNPPTISKIYFL